MLFQIPQDIDQEMAEILDDSIGDAIEDIEDMIELLISKPRDEASLNEIFRHLHSLKGNFRMCFLGPFSDCVHAIEETFSEIRNERIEFIPLIGEATLGTLDKIRADIRILAATKELEIESLDEIAVYFLNIASADAEQVHEHVSNLLGKALGMDCHLLPVAVELIQLDTEDNFSISMRGLEDDIRYFQTLSSVLDARVANWHGRTIRLLGIAAHVMDFLPYEVDRKQLHAAIYMHDIGMAFISGGVIGHRGKLTLEQHEAIGRHPHIGYQALQLSTDWEEAATIVIQHHEWMDGSGYPHGLKADEICNGAKFLSVADAFLSLTSKRADRSKKRTVLRALMEISNHTGTQFDEGTAKAFTAMASKVYRNS